MERYTVLFVDDEPSILRALSRLFHQDNISVLTATGGEEALALFGSHQIQLMVTDNIMPGMTGVELTKRVKDISPDTFRMILSGQSDMEAVLQAVNQGEAFRFMLKPWVEADLKANVYIALSLYKLRQDKQALEHQVADQRQLLLYLQRKHPEIFDSLEEGHGHVIEIGNPILLVHPTGSEQT